MFIPVPARKEFLGLIKDVGVLRVFIPISFHSNKLTTTTTTTTMENSKKTSLLQYYLIS
jgi:hypothetical protein